MSSIKDAQISRKKKDLTNSKQSYLGTKRIQFHHQATEADGTIDLMNLNGWISKSVVVSPRAANFSSNAFAWSLCFTMSSPTAPMHSSRELNCILMLLAVALASMWLPVS